ncbi:hypothetical protein SUGI_0472630 [Cryptomeria japonica]|nr:hypothetical protein SUGI_0472630 [Cryptomeria japonica]
MGIGAYVSGDEIHLSADYVGNYEGDVKEDIRGVLYHEMTHVWQWNGKDNAPSGLIEGVADYVCLTIRLVPSHWLMKLLPISCSIVKALALDLLPT